MWHISCLCYHHQHYLKCFWASFFFCVLKYLNQKNIHFNGTSTNDAYLGNHLIAWRDDLGISFIFEMHLMQSFCIWIEINEIERRKKNLRNVSKRTSYVKYLHYPKTIRLTEWNDLTSLKINLHEIIHILRVHFCVEGFVVKLHTYVCCSFQSKSFLQWNQKLCRTEAVLILSLQFS